MDSKTILFIIASIIGVGCVQSEQIPNKDDNNEDVVEVFSEPPIEILKKPRLKLPDSLSINGENGYTVIHIYVDKSGEITKKIGALVLKDKSGVTVIEYIENEESSEIIRVTGIGKNDLSNYLRWIDSNLNKLKVKLKENINYRMNIFTPILIRIE